MIALAAAVFLASLLGSLHCVGMCGAFVAFAVGPDGTAPSRTMLQLNYHLGRLVTYVLLGVAAGSLGALTDLAGALAGLQPIATSLAGGIILVFGLVTLLRLLGARLPRVAPPAWVQSLLQAGHRAAFRFSPPRRALAIGLLTTLLPCGWLYAFAITAAGTASPLYGGVVMAVFWLGTLPALVALGTGLQASLGFLGRRLPVLTCLALIVVGLFTLVGRLSLDPAAIARSASDRAAASGTATPTHHGPACHDAAH